MVQYNSSMLLLIDSPLSPSPSPLPSQLPQNVKTLIGDLLPDHLKEAEVELETYFLRESHWILTYTCIWPSDLICCHV